MRLKQGLNVAKQACLGFTNWNTENSQNGCFWHFLATFRVENWQLITLPKTHATKNITQIYFDVSNNDLQTNGSKSPFPLLAYLGKNGKIFNWVLASQFLC